MIFTRATKAETRLRIAIMGASGSGKTYSALSIATALSGKVALVDTEHGSASKYSDVFNFDTLQLTNHNPNEYIEAIKAAENAGYAVLIIDSLSHAWNGNEGALELVDQAAAKTRSGNTYTAWKDVTPLQRLLIAAILASKMHILCTLRSKTEYVLEQDKNGKMSPRKIGTAPIQRDGIEYEFDIVLDLGFDHVANVTKTRCAALDGQMIPNPGSNIATTLKAWIASDKSKEDI